MAINENNQILVGTCGWSYKGDWDTVFYPPNLKMDQYLIYYSQIFRYVEIDSSFYHIPRKNVVENWINNTPENFSFSAKIPQEITHKHKLQLDLCQSAIVKYLYNIFPLEQKHKMIGHLLQLPPSFTFEKNFPDLQNFIQFWYEWRENVGKSILGSKFSSQNFQLIVEFRHLSWMKENIFRYLKENHVGYCAVIEPLLPPRMDITQNSLFYMRFHGYGKKPWWNYLFNSEEMDHWTKQILTLNRNNPNTKIVLNFNNHFSGNAVKNALDIMPRLGIKPVNSLEEVMQKYSSRKILKLDKKGALDKWIKKE